MVFRIVLSQTESKETWWFYRDHILKSFLKHSLGFVLILELDYMSIKPADLIKCIFTSEVLFVKSETDYIAQAFLLTLTTLCCFRGDSSLRFLWRTTDQRPTCRTDLLSLSGAYLNGCPSSDFWMACRMPLYILKQMVTESRARPM